MTARDAPLDRRWFETGTPFFRPLLGLLFVGISAASTIVLAGGDIQAFIGDKTTFGLLADCFWYSTIFAAVLFVGKVITHGKRKYARVYPVFLWPDVFYTARGCAVGIGNVAEKTIVAAVPKGAYEQGIEQVITFVVTWIIVGAIGFVMARWDEALLFCKPKTERAKARRDVSMPIDPQHPPEWLLAGVLIILLLIIIGIARLIHEVAEIRAGRRRVNLRPLRDALGRWAGRMAQPSRVQPVRPRLNYRSRLVNAVPTHSAHLNAEYGGVQARSDVQRSANPVQSVQPSDPSMPRDMDELRKLIHAHALYALRPNKQIAIETTWGCTKGEGEAWQRASALFDATKPPKAPKEAEAQLQEGIQA